MFIFPCQMGQCHRGGYCFIASGSKLPESTTTLPAASGLTWSLRSHDQMWNMVSLMVLPFPGILRWSYRCWIKNSMLPTCSAVRGVLSVPDLCGHIQYVLFLWMFHLKINTILTFYSGWYGNVLQFQFVKQKPLLQFVPFFHRFHWIIKHTYTHRYSAHS